LLAKPVVEYALFLSVVVNPDHPGWDSVVSDDPTYTAIRTSKRKRSSEEGGPKKTRTTGSVSPPAATVSSPPMAPVIVSGETVQVSREMWEEILRVSQDQQRIMEKLGGASPSPGTASSATPTSPVIPEHGEQELQCKVCHKKFFNSARLQSHIKTAHKGEGRVACRHCSETFATSSYAKKHEAGCSKKSQQVKEYPCAFCESTFDASWKLAQHRKQHQMGGSWECPFPECTKSYNTESAMRAHKSTCKYRPGFQPAKCLFCTRSYTRPQDCNYHMRKDHGWSKK
jgi:hypothetical protein